MLIQLGSALSALLSELILTHAARSAATLPVKAVLAVIAAEVVHVPHHGPLAEGISVAAAEHVKVFRLCLPCTVKAVL
jgi:hypothetical protein